jgi:hypothetical protein
VAEAEEVLPTLAQFTALGVTSPAAATGALKFPIVDALKLGKNIILSIHQID